MDKNKKGYKSLQVPCEIKAEDVGDDGTFKGYGSTFGGQPDSHGDIIMEGAFHDTIMANGRNKNGIAMLYQHNAHEPIGVWTHLMEDKRGLYVEGKLELQVQRAKECHALMKLGALRGLSIGYDFPKDPETGKPQKDSFEIVEDEQGRRIWHLKKLELWEISPVTFPANVNANIMTVKDFKGCENERDLEIMLRDSGLSKCAAQYIVSLCKDSLRDSKTVEKEVVAGKSEWEVILEELQKRNDF